MKNEMEKRFRRYERSYDFLIPPRNYVILRMDGVGFSKYTKKFNKPFDDSFANAMEAAAKAVGDWFSADLVYTQSDEISIVFTDIGNENAQLIYDGKVRKILSVSASIVASYFTKYLLVEKYSSEFGLDIDILNEFPPPSFDSRILVISDIREVVNYFISRQKDGTRNSVQMQARYYFSHNELKNKNQDEMKKMLNNIDKSWDMVQPRFKYGSVMYKQNVVIKHPEHGEYVRNVWKTKSDYIFTDNFESTILKIKQYEKK